MRISSKISTLRNICRKRNQSETTMGSQKRATLRDIIKNKMLLRETKELRFVPETALKDIFNKENVAEALRMSGSFSETDIPPLVSFICDKAIKLFAILVWSEAEKLIGQFYQHQLRDGSLPIYCDTEDEDNVKAFTYKPYGGKTRIPDHPFNHEQWTERTIEHFCKDDQWPFLSPVFTSNQFRYDFPESIHLPFVDSCYRSQKESNFSVVQEWRIHRDHLQVPNYVVRHSSFVILISFVWTDFKVASSDGPR
jgi:hypothetical protein